MAVCAAGEVRGAHVEGVDDAEAIAGVTVFHARTARDVEGRLVTAGGGRILAVTGEGATVAEARERAYAGIALIRFDGMQYRSDIAERAGQRR